MWVTWQKNQEWDGIMSNRHTETRAHHRARTSWTCPGGGPRTGAQASTVVWRLRGCKEGRTGGRKKGRKELSWVSWRSHQKRVISLQNCQKCQNNKETLFAGRTLFTWLITSISAFFRLLMNLWYCTPFFYNSSTHRKRCQSLQNTGSEVSVYKKHGKWCQTSMDVFATEMLYVLFGCLIFALCWMFGNLEMKSKEFVMKILNQTSSCDWSDAFTVWPHEHMMTEGA